MTPVTPEEQCFIDAILADHRDTTARLVFADYLDEHDRPIEASILRTWGPFAWHLDERSICLYCDVNRLCEVCTYGSKWHWHCVPIAYASTCVTLEAAQRCAYTVLILTLLATEYCLVTYDTGQVEIVESSDNMTLSFPPGSFVVDLHESPHVVMRFTRPPSGISLNCDTL